MYSKTKDGVIVSVCNKLNSYPNKFLMFDVIIIWIISRDEDRDKSSSLLWFFNLCFTEVLVETSVKTLFSLMTPNLLCPPKTDHQHLLHPLLPVWNVCEALRPRCPRLPVLQKQHFWWLPHSPPFGNNTLSFLCGVCVCVCVCLRACDRSDNWEYTKCQTVSKTSTATIFYKFTSFHSHYVITLFFQFCWKIFTNLHRNKSLIKL